MVATTPLRGVSSGPTFWLIWEAYEIKGLGAEWIFRRPSTAFTNRRKSRGFAPFSALKPGIPRHPLLLTAAARRVDLGITAPISLIGHEPGELFPKLQNLSDIRDLSQIVTMRWELGRAK